MGKHVDLKNHPAFPLKQHLEKTSFSGAWLVLVVKC